MELKHLLKLVDAVSESSLTEFSYEEGETKIRFRKEPGQMQVVPAVSVPSGTGTAVVEEEVEAVVPEEGGKLILSPLVGTFYSAPAEGAESFVSVGDHVKKGQTLAIVEAMKLMNEIESDYDGVVEAILVENGEPVEYNQPLFRIR